MSARYDLFVSHSSDDKARVDKIVNYLESRNFHCFLSSRLVGGERWNEEIQDALVNSSAVLLVLSQSSREKKYVANEVAIAVDEGIKILPLRIDKVDYGPLLRIHCVSTQWVDAHGSLFNSGMEMICRSLPRVNDEIPPEDPPPQGPSSLRLASEKIRERMRSVPGDRPSPEREGGNKNIALVTVIVIALIAFVSLAMTMKGIGGSAPPADCSWTTGTTKVPVQYEFGVADSETSPPLVNYDSPCTKAAIPLSYSDDGEKSFKGDVIVPGDGSEVRLVSEKYFPVTIGKDSKDVKVSHND